MEYAEKKAEQEKLQILILNVKMSLFKLSTMNSSKILASC